jgi:hypothetical protein
MPRNSINCKGTTCPRSFNDEFEKEEPKCGDNNKRNSIQCSQVRSCDRTFSNNWWTLEVGKSFVLVPGSIPRTGRNKAHNYILLLDKAHDYILLLDKAHDYILLLEYYLLDSFDKTTHCTAHLEWFKINRSTFGTEISS